MDTAAYPPVKGMNLYTSPVLPGDSPFHQNFSRVDGNILTLHAPPKAAAPLFFATGEMGIVYNERMSPVLKTGGHCQLLQKGHTLTWDGTRVVIRETEPLALPGIDRGMTLASAIETVRELLISSLEARLRTVQKPGICISGGVDSFLVAWIVTKVLGRDDAEFFTIYRPSMTDRRDLDGAVQHLDLLGIPEERRHMIDLTAWHPDELVKEAATRYELSGPDGRFVAKVGEVAMAMTAERVGVDCILLGSGADQLHYSHQLLEPTRHVFKYLTARFPEIDVGSDEFAALAVRTVFRRWVDPMSAFYCVPDIQSQAKLFRPSIDVYSPFFDSPVEEFYATMPKALRHLRITDPGYTPTTRKVVLREVMRGFAPDSRWRDTKAFLESYASGRASADDGFDEALTPKSFRRFTVGSCTVAEATQ